jgi:hypothetical protein
MLKRIRDKKHGIKKNDSHDKKPPNNSGSASSDNISRTVMYMISLIYIANMAVVERLLDKSKSQNHLEFKYLIAELMVICCCIQSQVFGYKKLTNNPKNIIGIGKTVLHAHGRGIVQLSDGNSKSVMLQSILYVPDLKMSYCH